MATEFKKLLLSLKDQPKTWLVTGAAGFIGSNLVEFLLKQNQRVIGVDNFSTGYRHNIEQIAASVGNAIYQNFTFFEGDINDKIICQKACDKVDIVLHQAALGSVPRSIADPIATNMANLTGFLTLLTVAKDSGVKRFVYASSSSVYGDSEELPKVESRTGKLLSPYAVTKYANELYAGVFFKLYGIETIGLRYFNVFGRRQDPNGAYAAVIPKWVASLLKNETVFINGDGETSRDFCYIDNVIQMNLLAGTTNNFNAFGEVFNVAVGGQTTLNQLYELIIQELGRIIPRFSKQTPSYKDFRSGDIRHSNANISKAREILGYEPTHAINEGMALAVQWYTEV